MIIKSKAIVIKSFSYGESSLISRVLIDNGQKLSLIIKGAKSLKSNKSALFQSLNFIEIQYYQKDNREIQLFKEGYLIKSFRNVKKTFESMKYSLAMIDIIDKVLPKDYQDIIMFEIMLQSLDQIEDNVNCKLIFIVFLILFSHYNGYSIKDFDIDYLKSDTLTKIFSHSSGQQNEYLQLLQSINNIDSTNLIEKLLLFIRMHIPEIKNVKSLKFIN